MKKDDINSFFPGGCGHDFSGVNFKHNFTITTFTHCPLGDVTMILMVQISNTTWVLIPRVFKHTLPWNECQRTGWCGWLSQCSGNGVVPSGNKPIPEPMLTQICVTMYGSTRPQWAHQSLNKTTYIFQCIMIYFIIPLKFVPEGPTDKKISIVWIILCMHAPSQWDDPMRWRVHCNIASNWLDAYTEWSLHWLVGVRKHINITWANVDKALQFHNGDTISQCGYQWVNAKFFWEVVLKLDTRLTQQHLGRCQVIYDWQ